MVNEKMKMMAGELFRKLGYQVSVRRLNNLFEPDMENEFKKTYFQFKPYTMTPLSRMYSLYKATKYVSENNIPGDIVECGVWKGGSSMISAHTLLSLRDTSRDFYLYDTYEGMSEPSSKDSSFFSKKDTLSKWKELQTSDHNEWDYSPLEEVKTNIISTGYPKEKIHFVKGKVEDTLPGTIPKKISILRLDTDWYESTYHSLIHLFPLLSSGGILIIDDYGHWKGAHDAVDKYFKEKQIPILLNRIDYSGRIGVKV